jgi:protein gp37
MGEKSKIQWCDSTLNEEMGCDGCELWSPKRGVRICYAGVDTENKTSRGPLKGWPVSFDRPTVFPERIALLRKWKDLTGTARPDKPWLNGLPRVIFWDDMGDMFTASLDPHRLSAYLPEIATTPHLNLFLTKRPDRAAAWSRTVRLPENIWIGTSITSPQDARLRALARAKAAKLFVSYEPVLANTSDAISRFPEMTWWIVGGASGKDAPVTRIEYLNAVVARGAAVGAAVFVKQVGSRPVVSDPSGWRCKSKLLSDDGGYALDLRDAKGGDWTEWTDDLRVRKVPR